MWDLARRWVGAPALRLMHPQTPDSPGQKEPPILRKFPRTPRPGPLPPSARRCPQTPGSPDRRGSPEPPQAQPPRRSAQRPLAQEPLVVSARVSPAQIVATKDRLGQLHVRVKRVDHNGRIATLLRAQRHLLDVGLTSFARVQLLAKERL